MANEVIILFEGYSFEDPEDSSAMRANCSCTLVKCKNNYNIIVDTLTPWDREKLIEELAAYDLQPEDINAVVNTHGHSDHCGNNNLFTNAEWLIVGNCISFEDKYLKQDLTVDPFKLTEDVSVLWTPGHTPACVSVIVEDTNLGPKVGICGDLFEREEDIYNPFIWIACNDGNPKQQEKNRVMMVELVNYIIPGHGKGFEVTEEIRKKILENYD